MPSASARLAMKTAPGPQESLDGHDEIDRLTPASGDAITPVLHLVSCASMSQRSAACGAYAEGQDNDARSVRRGGARRATALPGRAVTTPRMCSKPPEGARRGVARFGVLGSGAVLARRQTRIGASPHCGVSATERLARG